MIATVAAVSGDADAACEAVDEAFARAWSRRARVEAMESPAGWVLTVAFNELRRAKSGRARRRKLEHRAATVEWIAPTDARHELWAAVGELPAQERTAVALRYLADLTEPQIAEVMGVATGTVSATLHSARRRLATSPLIVKEVTER